MRNFYRIGLFASTLIIVLLAFSANSYGQQGGANPAAYNGYQLGYGAGSNDRAAGQSPKVERNKTFRNADSGYSNSGYGSKDQYKQVFRNAYRAGYQDGYSGSPRQIYYSGDYNNNGGTSYGNDPGYPYSQVRERHHRQRARKNRNSY
jgi:hypothetical protein